MRKLTRFYASTEGLVITVGLYITVAYLISVNTTVLAAEPVLAVPLALGYLLFGGVGFFLWADALTRVFDTVGDAFSASLNSVLP